MKKIVRRTSLKAQIENIPEEIKQADREAYNNGEISQAELQHKWVAAGFLSRRYSTRAFGGAIAAHGFRQLQSHGVLADHPQFMVNWDWEKNEEDGIFPEELTLGSGRQAWFTCSAGVHESQKREVKRHVVGDGCSKCAYELRIPAMHEAASIANSTPTKGVNDLATVRPDLVPFWSPRNDKAADEVCYSSHEKFWWVDKDGNEYINTPNRRTGYPAAWSPLDYWRDKCPDHYEVFEYIRSIVPKQYPILVEQKMLPECQEMKDKGYKQSLYVDIIVCIGPFKLLFEVNGPEHFKYGKRYHDRKVEAAAEMGYTLTHIWSHIWVMETKKCMDEIKNQIDFILSYQTGTKGNEMVAREHVQLDGDIIYRNGSDAA